MDPATAGRGHFEMHRFPQQRNDPTPRLGVTSAKNANQRDPRASADAESARTTSPGLLVLKTSSKCNVSEA